jgi:hypothetical protein
MRFFKKYYLAIALFSLRIPTIWSVMLIYSLFQVILLYFQVSFSFLPLNVVECAGLSAEDVVSSERTSQPNIIKEEVSGMLNSDKISQKYQDSKPEDLKVSVNLESDTATVLSSALTSIGKTFESYVPVISGAAVAGGTAVITKSLPVKQRFAGMIIAGGITSGTMLTSQYINLIFKEKYSKKEEDKIMSKINSLDIKPNWNTNSDIQDTNIQETISPTLETSYSINAPLEGFDNLSMMTLGIITINFFVILGLLLILINYLISYSKLESKKFVTDRPLLQKFLKASEKSRNFITKFVFLFIVFGTCSMFYFLCYLLYFLKDLGL